MIFRRAKRGSNIPTINRFGSKAEALTWTSLDDRLHSRGTILRLWEKGAQIRLVYLLLNAFRSPLQGSYEQRLTLETSVSLPGRR